MTQKITGLNRLDAKLFAATKVCGVVSNDVSTAGSDGEFKNHVIVGIGQHRSPQVEDFLQRGDGQKKIEKSIDVFGRPSQQVLGPLEHCRILRKQWNGNRRLKSWIRQQPKQPLRRSIAGPRRCHQHIGIKHDPAHFRNSLLTRWGRNDHLWKPSSNDKLLPLEEIGLTEFVAGFIGDYLPIDAPPMLLIRVSFGGAMSWMCSRPRTS